MNRIIVLCGDITSTFFLNEIEILHENFDDITIITYKSSKEKIEEITKQYNIKCIQINDKNLFKILSYDGLKWILSSTVFEEIKENCILKKSGLKKLIYILLYGVYYIQCKNIIQNEIKNNKNDNILLYSYWLSRPAYAISKFNENRYKNVKKIISRAHGYDLYLYRNNLNYLPFRKVIINNLDEIKFISDDGKLYFNENLIKYLEDKKDLRLSVNKLGTYNKSKIIKSNIQFKDEICIASCSRVISLKRLDLIIDLVSNIQMYTKVKWIHIGDGELINEMRLYAQKKLKQGSFEFLGNIDNKDIINIYKNADVDYFVNMSDYEGIPVSIMEALSVGIPCIARNIGGNREIINDNNGNLIDNIDEDSISTLAKYMVDLRTKKIQMYEMMSKNAYVSWDLCYNAEKNYSFIFKEMSDNIEKNKSYSSNT